jgi:hypothetical protein
MKEEHDRDIALLKEEMRDMQQVLDNTDIAERDKEIAGLKEKYDKDIALLKEAMRDMQQLLKNPEKLLNRKSLCNRSNPRSSSG